MQSHGGCRSPARPWTEVPVRFSEAAWVLKPALACMGPWDLRGQERGQAWASQLDGDKLERWALEARASCGASKERCEKKSAGLEL